MNHRNQITAFFICLILIVVSIYTINAWVDVSGMGSQNKVSMLAKKQIEGKTLVSSKAFDQRAWVRSTILERKSCPDLLILGSSTVGALSQDMFKDSMLNLWLTGPTIEDYEAIYSILSEARCAPKKIVIGIDPWFVNRNMVSDRWKTLIDDYWNYHHQGDSFGKYRIVVGRTWSKFKDRLSFITTRESVQLLLKKKSTQNDQIVLVDSKLADVCNSKLLETFPDGGREVNLRGSDGHFENCQQFLPSDDEVTKIAETYLSRNMHNVMDWHEVNMDSINRLHELVGKFSHGSKVMLVMPPYHPITYDLLLKNGVIKANLQKMNGELSKFGVEFMNLQNPNEIGCSAQDFDDSHHSSEVCLEKIAERIRNYF